MICVCVFVHVLSRVWLFCDPMDYGPPSSSPAAKSIQSCPTLCDPIDGSPPGSPVPGILRARTLEWAAISFSNAWKWSESEVAQSCPTLSDPMDCSLPGSSIHGILQARVLEWGAIASPYTCMSSTLKLTYVIFTTLWANYYYFYPHFTGEETGTKRLNNSSKSNANNWQNNLTTKLQLLSRKMHF